MVPQKISTSDPQKLGMLPYLDKGGFADIVKDFEMRLSYIICLHRCP